MTMVPGGIALSHTLIPAIVEYCILFPIWCQMTLRKWGSHLPFILCSSHQALLTCASLSIFLAKITQAELKFVGTAEGESSWLVYSHEMNISIDVQGYKIELYRSPTQCLWYDTDTGGEICPKKGKHPHPSKVRILSQREHGVEHWIAMALRINKRKVSYRDDEENPEDLPSGDEEKTIPFLRWVVSRFSIAESVGILPGFSGLLGDRGLSRDTSGRNVFARFCRLPSVPIYPRRACGTFNIGSNIIVEGEDSYREFFLGS